MRRMSLTLEHVKKTYRDPDGSAVPVLDVPAFSVAAGEHVALIGSSGSGKTTLLHVIAGIVTPDTGRVMVADGATQVPIDVASLGEADRDAFRGRSMGYVFQTHHLLHGFTAIDNVLLGMSFSGKRADRGLAEHLLAEVGLKDRLHYLPRKLSVGQQQRVAIARALANKPKLVLADEPTGALDASSAQQAIDLIRKLCAGVNASLLIVTHDRDIARQLGRVVDLAEINRAARGHIGRAA
jgi:putative ABC transport system ATP-binding protein